MGLVDDGCDFVEGECGCCFVFWFDVEQFQNVVCCCVEYLDYWYEYF